MSNETKKCPYCAEEIKAEAVVCKHCGRELAHIDSNNKKGLTIGDGVRTGCGMFIVLPIIIIAIIVFLAIVSRGCSGG